MKYNPLKFIIAAAFLVGPMSVMAEKVKTASFDTTVTELSTIVKIDKAAKAVSLKGPDGDITTVTIDPANVYLSNLKIGQQVTSTQAVNIIAELRKPSEAELADPFVVEVAAGTNNNINDPAASVNTKIHMVVTVAAKNKKAGSVTLEGPNGRTLEVNPTNPKVMKHLKPGKTVVVYYTSLKIIKLDPVKK